MGGLIGGIFGGGGGSSDGSQAASDATKAQVQASKDQIALYKDIFNKQLQLQTPQYNVGTQALQYLSGLYGFPINQSPYPITPLGQNQSFSGTGSSGGGPGTGGNTGQGGDGTPEVTDINGHHRDWVRHCSVHPNDPACKVHFGPSGMAPGAGAGGTTGAGTGTGTTPSTGQNLLSAQQYQTNFNNLIQADPGYNFRLQQGQKALDRQAAAGGRLYSGRQLQATQRYGQDYASNEFGNAYNRLAGLAGLQQTATNQLGNQLSSYGQAAGQSLGNIGDARASGYINNYQSGQNSYNNLLNTAGTAGNLFSIFRGG